jgi:hypothetical protein
VSNLNAWSATRETREFLRGNGFLGPCRVMGSRTDREAWRDENGWHRRVDIRTVVNVDTPERREAVIAAAREQLSDVLHVHRLDRDDKVARYCAIAIVWEGGP